MRISFLHVVGTLLFALSMMTTMPAMMAPRAVMESPAVLVEVSVVQTVRASDANTSTMANSSDGQDARRQAFQRPRRPTTAKTSTTTTLPTPEKPLLVLITAMSRPNNLPVLLAHILPLQKCFDVRWLVVFAAGNSKHWEQEGFVRDSFPWATQLRANDKNITSRAGHVEKNIALDFMQSNPHLRNGTGFMYFLDDDNFPPFGLCTAPMDTDVIYFGNQSTLSETATGRMGWRRKTVIPSADMFNFQSWRNVARRSVKKRLNVRWSGY